MTLTYLVHHSTVVLQGVIIEWNLLTLQPSLRGTVILRCQHILDGECCPASTCFSECSIKQRFCNAIFYKHEKYKEHLQLYCTSLRQGPGQRRPVEPNVNSLLNVALTMIKANSEVFDDKHTQSIVPMHSFLGGTAPLPLMCVVFDAQIKSRIFPIISSSGLKWGFEPHTIYPRFGTYLPSMPNARQLYCCLHVCSTLPPKDDLKVHLLRSHLSQTRWWRWSVTNLMAMSRLVKTEVVMVFVVVSKWE